MIIEIHNGKNKVFAHRFYLVCNGYTFVKRKYGKSYYKKKIQNEHELSEIKLYCKENKLKLLTIEEKYIRNSNYRKNFIDNKKWHLCAYCGFPFETAHMTIDHIIPIDKAKKNKGFARFLMKLLKINNINDSKNLTYSCNKCNNFKRAKMGIWTLWGFMSKFQFLMIVRWGIRFIILYTMAKMIILQ